MTEETVHKLLMARVRREEVSEELSRLVKERGRLDKQVRTILKSCDHVKPDGSSYIIADVYLTSKCGLCGMYFCAPKRDTEAL